MEGKKVLIVDDQDIELAHALKTLDKEWDKEVMLPFINARLPGPDLFENRKKKKPTCDRNHEYIEHKTQDGNIIHSEWRCRFCNKPL